MTDAWEVAQKLVEKHANQGGIFVRLANDGDKVVGVFCGDPYAREVYWDGAAFTETPPESGTVKCSVRTAMNFFVPAEGAMKIIEGNSMWFKDVVAVRDKYGLAKWSFEIKRHGKAKDTKTKYSILPESPVDDALRAKIAAAPLHDLGATVADAVEASVAAGAAPIDLDTAHQVIERLRPLPRTVADAFLKEFRISRIRELLSVDLPAALRFIDRHVPSADPLAL
jgi:hypothetical protein